MRRTLLCCLVLSFPLVVHPASAQSTPEADTFMRDMIEITNDISQETAKDAYKKCLAMGDRLKTLTGLIDAQRLYFESEVERCQFYAMNNGNFSDAAGDQCSHHIAYTKKLASVIDASLAMPNTEGEFMANFAEQLESAMRMGPEMGCKFDYISLSKTQEAAKAHGEKQPREPDFAFMEEIQGVINSIAPETAKDDITKCAALKTKLAEKKELFPFEQHYYPSLIESCVATAIEKGAAADDGGDACAHHYARSIEGAKAVAESRKQQVLFGAFTEMLQEDLKGTAAHAKELGCKQDFSAVKEEG